MFFSFFLLVNFSPNSRIIFFSFVRISYISLISSFASFESNIRILSRTFSSDFLTASLVTFAISLASNVIFLSVTHVLNFIPDAIVYALSQLSKFNFSISNCSISSFIIK